MEAAIQTMVKVFLKSSKGKESLGKKEFQNLVKSQLSNILTDTDSKEAVNNMGQGLDADQDGKVGFEEFLKLVGYLAMSLSEQQSKPNGEQTTVNNVNAEANSEPKPEAAEVTKAEAGEEVKVETNAGGGLKVEVKAEGQTAKDVKPADGGVSLSGALAEVPGVVEVVAAAEKPACVEIVTSGEPATIEVSATELPAAAVETLASKVEVAVNEVVTVETETVEVALEEAAAVVEEAST